MNKKKFDKYDKTFINTQMRLLITFRYKEIFDKE